MVVVVRQLVDEAAVVVVVPLLQLVVPLLQLVVPLLQLAHSVAQRLLLLRFLLFQQRPRLPMPPMRMLQRPAVEAAVQDVVVGAAEEAQLLPQRRRRVQRCRLLFIARVRFEL